MTYPDYIVFSFIERLGDSRFETPPLGGQHVDLVSRLCNLLSWVLRSLHQSVVNCLAHGGPELFRDTSQFSHLLSPVLEASLTDEIVDQFPWVRGCAQQGGILFELKSEPTTLQCLVEEEGNTSMSMSD